MPYRAADYVKPQLREKSDSNGAKIQEVQLIKQLQVNQQFKTK